MTAVNFVYINAVAMRNIRAVLSRWLPRGRVEGHEYVTLNPMRADRHTGSFKVNMRTGKWADFATGDRGGDVISLAAFLFDMSQVEAARKLARMLGVEHD